MLLSIITLCGVACSGAVTGSLTPFPMKHPFPTAIGPQRDADLPAPPFPDNPDPTTCGIPMPWHGYELTLQALFSLSSLDQSHPLGFDTGFGVILIVAVLIGILIYPSFAWPVLRLAYWLVRRPRAW